MKVSAVTVCALTYLGSIGCAVDREAAMQRLRAVGQAVYDADTVEANGSWTRFGDAAEGPLPFHCALGAGGQYHFRMGDVRLIRDTQHLASHVPAEEHVYVDKIQVGESVPGPKNRWPADIIMAAGMGLGGKGDQFLAEMRVLGEGWTEHFFGELRFTGAIRDVVSGRECIRCTFRREGNKFHFWVDADDPVLWKWSMEGDHARIEFQYDDVKLNPVLPPDEFHIPDWMFRENQNDLKP